MLIYENYYTGETLPDMGPDVIKAVDPDINDIVKSVPLDINGNPTGQFKVEITWSDGLPPQM